MATYFSKIKIVSPNTVTDQPDVVLFRLSIVFNHKFVNVIAILIHIYEYECERLRVVITVEHNNVYNKKLDNSNIILQKTTVMYPFGHHPDHFGFLL